MDILMHLCTAVQDKTNIFTATLIIGNSYINIMTVVTLLFTSIR